MLTFHCSLSLQRMLFTVQGLAGPQVAGIDNPVKEVLEKTKSNFLIWLINIILLEYCLGFFFICSWKCWGQLHVILIWMNLSFWKEYNFDQNRTSYTKCVGPPSTGSYIPVAISLGPTSGVHENLLLKACAAALFYNTALWPLGLLFPQRAWG